MLCKQNHEIITETDLVILNKFVSTPLILFNCENIAYVNDECSLLFGCNNSNIQVPIKTKQFFMDDKFIDGIEKILESGESLKFTDTFIITANFKKIFIKLDYKIVLYKSSKYILAHLFDITEKLNVQSKLMKFSMVRNLMLDVSQSIIKTEDISQIYQLILNNAIRALEKAKIGTIFIKKDDIFKVVAHAGFSEEILGFQLNIQDAFLYRATDGKMDTIKNIADLMTFNSYYPIKTTLGEEYIKSTLTAPININNTIYGMINIDSVEVNAFDDDDIQYMAFMKNCIEIAISNFLLYEERIYLANHDSLTKLYNRFYIEEKFEKCKDDAVRNNLTFYLVIFDIDNLKDINDKYGHSEGDLAILKIVDELKKMTNKNDILARVGGDEFLGIFYDENEDSILNKIENSLRDIDNKIKIDNHHISCSFSFGISTFGKDGNTFKELFKIADDRMYLLKKYRIN